ncbi:ABC transporter ATP-binding protein [Desulfobaculum senezii]
MSLLHVSAITKRFDARYSLSDISFGLDEGEVLCFLGPSGCGKTTLLRIIAGLERADSGAVHLGGAPLHAIPPHQRGFGMMFQEYALFPHLNVAQNVAFGLRMRGDSPSQRAARVTEMLQLVGLKGREDSNIADLSGGERQRVALARSLAPQPRLLMLDEPLAALDRALRERLARDLRNILKTVGVTAIFVTHDQSEAFAIADKVAVFDDGKLLQMGAPEDVYTRPASETVARFLGFRNIYPVLGAEGRTVRTALGTLRAPQAAEEPTHLLIRPEGARIATSKDIHAAMAKHPDCGSIISGTVRERTFLGHSIQITLEARAQTLVRVLLPLAPTPPPVGDPIAITVPDESLVLLDAEYGA